eukprot:6214482-Pleurochrysis_carterae.AAC.2
MSTPSSGSSAPPRILPPDGDSGFVSCGATSRSTAESSTLSPATDSRDSIAGRTPLRSFDISTYIPNILSYMKLTQL